MADNTVRGRFVWHELMTPDASGAHAFYGKVVGWKTQTFEHDPSYQMFAAASGQPGGAARLFGASEAAADQLGADLFETDAYRPWYESAVAKAREALGPDAFDTAMHAGREYSRAQALDEAMAVFAPPPREKATSAFGLSMREHEVLRLLAQGHTNRAIADQLYIAEATVKVHVTAIFTKLGVDSRSAATAFAIHNDLA